MITRPGYIWLTLFSALVTSCYAVTTCNMGTDAPSAHISILEDPRQTDTAFFLQGSPSTCCGKLRNWMYHVANATFVGETIEAQLWRSTGGLNYELIAQESLVVPAVGINTHNATFPEADVKIGDIVGWEMNGDEIIPYDTTGGYDVQMNTIGAINVGNSIAWGQTPVTGRAYAFGAVVTKNEVPVVNDDSVTFSDTALPTVFSTVTVTDTESALADLTIALETNTYFELDGLDIKEITPNTVPAGVYTLIVTAEDNCDTANGTITITITGTAPILNVPYVHGTTYQDDFNSATDTFLFNVIVTDSDPDTCAILSDPTKFTIDSSSPPNYPVSLLAGGDLNFDNVALGEELIVVNCTDQSGLSVTGTYTVSLSDASPTITGGSPSTSIDNETPGGTALPHTFTCTDSDDTLLVAINPANAEFTIDSSAAPTYTVKVDAVPLTVTTHTLTIECKEDDATPAIVTDTYTVTVTNKPPVVSNGTGPTNDGFQLAEEPLGLFTCTDGIDTCTCTVSDPVNFYANGSHPNFEVWRQPSITLTPGTIDLTVSCTDGSTSVDGYFTVIVGNTAPAWDTPPGTSDYALPDNTLSAPGTPLGNFSLLDPDTCTCVITAPASHPYVLNQLTTVDPQVWSVTTIASPLEDDIDFNDGSTVDLTIECDDGTNPVLTGTFTVDLEDSPPVATGLPGSKTVNEGAQPAEEYIPFTCVDGDDGCTCTIADPAAPPSPRFEIQGTYPNYALWSVAGGVLTLAESVITLDITCTDGTAANDVTQQFDVTVANLPPVITNLNATHTSSYFDNFTSATDEFLYKILVTDPNPDTCTPDNPKFTIVNSAPGEYDLYLVAGADLNYDNDPQEVVVVTCTDTSGGSSTGTYILPIEDAPPVLTGLPGTPYDAVSDATVNATPLNGTEFDCTDSDDVCTCNVDPAATVEDAIFEVLPVPGGSATEFLLGVKANPSLDGSATPNYTVPIVCTDGNTVVTETKIINIANQPPVFATLDLLGTINVTVLESETGPRELYRECVEDTTKLYCYRTDTLAAPPIKLKVEHGAAPCTAELIVSLQNDPRLDFESGPGVMYLDLTCEDKEWAVTQKLTVLIANMAPTIKNPGGSKTLKETLDPAKEVKLKDIKLERYDFDADCRVSNNDGGPFEVVKEKKYNVLKKMPGVLDFETKSEYNLEIECEDAAGNITTDTYTVYVENVGPIIKNTEWRVLVSESERSPDDVLYLPLTTSEFANHCYQTSSETDFIVKLIPPTSQWGVYYKGGSKLDYDKKKPKYPLTIQCDDGNGLLGPEKKVNIDLLKNENPKFINLKNVTSVVAKKTPQDTEVFEILTEDPENDPVNLTVLSCSCPECPLELVAGTGKVITTRDLATYDLDFACTLMVQVNDEFNTPDPKPLVIEIEDANHVPKITFLPKKIDTFENRAIGDSIFTITRDYNFVDDDSTDVPTFECVFPDGGDDLFECDPDTGEIKVIGNIDFETQKNEYYVDITVKDDWNSSTSQRTKIKVWDEIEPLEFTQTEYEITHGEGKAGDLLGCPAWQIKDEDLWGYYIYSMETCEDGLVMNHATGCVYQTREFDLDATIRQDPYEFSCTVRVEESGAELDQINNPEFIGEATLKFKITDADDNAPHFDQRQYVLCAAAGSASTTVPVTAVDNDVAARNKDLTFSMTGGPPVGFTTNADGTSGEITVGDVSSYPLGTRFSRTLHVTDKQGNADNIPVDVVVCEPPPVVVVPPTNNNNNNNNAGTTSSNDMLYWLIPAGLLLALMAGLLTFLCWKCWRNGGCGRVCGGGSRPRHPKVTKVRETPPKRARTPPRRARTPPKSPTPPKEPPGKLPECEMAMTK